MQRQAATILRCVNADAACAGVSLSGPIAGATSYRTRSASSRTGCSQLGGARHPASFPRFSAIRSSHDEAVLGYLPTS